MAIGIHYLYTGNFHARLAARKTNEKTRCKIQASVIFIYERNFCPAGGGGRERRQAPSYRLHWRPTVSALTDRKSRAEQSSAESQRDYKPKLLRRHQRLLFFLCLFAQREAYLLN